MSLSTQNGSTKLTIGPSIVGAKSCDDMLQQEDSQQTVDFKNGFNNKTAIIEKRKFAAYRMARFSKCAYFCILIFVTLLSSPFYIPVIVLLREDQKDVHTCRSYFPLVVTLLTISGFLVNSCALICSVLVFINLNHPILVKRGRSFVIQIAIICPILCLLGYFSSIAFFGTLTGDCFYSYNINTGNPELPWQTSWTGKAVMVRVSMDLVLHCLIYFSVAAVTGRQTVLYKLFIDNQGGTKSYNATQLRLIYAIPAIATAIAMIAFLGLQMAAFALYLMSNGDHQKCYDIANLLVYIQGFLGLVYALALLSFFIYITHKTRHVDLEISDRMANIRLICMFVAGFFVLIVVRAITKTEYNMMMGAMLTYCYWMVFGLVYLLDTFTAVWMHIYFGFDDKWEAA
eukprot:Awhi_evm1s12331